MKEFKIHDDILKRHEMVWESTLELNQFGKFWSEMRLTPYDRHLGHRSHSFRDVLGVTMNGHIYSTVLSKGNAFAYRHGWVERAKRAKWNIGGGKYNPEWWLRREHQLNEDSMFYDVTTFMENTAVLALQQLRKEI